MYRIIKLGYRATPLGIVNVREAEGVLYHSRFTGDVCVAIFDKATHKLELRGAMSLVRSAAFLQALSDYEITLVAA